MFSPEHIGSYTIHKYSSCQWDIECVNCISCWRVIHPTPQKKGILGITITASGGKATVLEQLLYYFIAITSSGSTF